MTLNILPMNLPRSSRYHVGPVDSSSDDDNRLTHERVHYNVFDIQLLIQTNFHINPTGIRH